MTIRFVGEDYSRWLKKSGDVIGRNDFCSLTSAPAAINADTLSVSPLDAALIKSEILLLTGALTLAHIRTCLITRHLLHGKIIQPHAPEDRAWTRATVLPMNRDEHGARRL
jgi:hypothetical protein